MRIYGEQYHWDNGGEEIYCEGISLTIDKLFNGESYSKAKIESVISGEINIELPIKNSSVEVIGNKVRIKF